MPLPAIADEEKPTPAQIAESVRMMQSIDNDTIKQETALAELARPQPHVDAELHRQLMEKYPDIKTMTSSELDHKLGCLDEESRNRAAYTEKCRAATAKMARLNQALVSNKLDRDTVKAMSRIVKEMAHEKMKLDSGEILPEHLERIMLLEEPPEDADKKTLDSEEGVGLLE
jgi:hypothetical protein